LIKEAIGYGSTIEEARENAVLKLNANDDADVQFDVIAFPKKKILGLFGGKKAEVKAFVEIPDEKKPHHKNAKPQKNNLKNKNHTKKENTKPVKPAKTSKPAKTAKPVITETEENFIPEAELPKDSRSFKAVTYLKPILENLGCTNITIKVAEKENSAIIDLEGDGLGILIGRRGETLDSLQYLAGLAANTGGGYFKVSLNIGDYRKKREETLRSLAIRICEQVKSTGKCRTLEPMNPYERRIIHTTVQSVEGVTSASFGEGVERRVVIGPEGSPLRPLRQNRSGKRDHHSNYRRNGKKPNNTVNSAPARAPKKDSDIPLYGKIN
jgi:spoIIIJ-associated protein